jgi:hypothetical protein
MRVPLLIRAAAVPAFCLLALTACGSTSNACGAPVREPLDPDHLLHVTDPNAVTYRSDTPTSGAHLSAGGPTGVVDEPLLPAVQVAVLERGDVLVQYRDQADAATLGALARDRVVVAPRPTLTDRVVVTAWTYRLSCRDVDTAAVGKFIDAHAGKGQSH